MLVRYLFIILMPYLFAILRPDYWVSIYPYSKRVDKELLRLLEEGTSFTDITTYTAKFGPYTLWIENHPAASFSIYSSSTASRVTVLPSRYTRKKLMDKLTEDSLKSHLNLKT